LDQSSRELLPYRVVALPVGRDQLYLAAEYTFLAGIDQHIVVLGEHHALFVFRVSIVHHRKRGAGNANDRRLARKAPLGTHPAGSDRTTFQHLAVVDLLHRKLRRMQLQEAIDGQIAGKIL
jgi:hypothetical protein